MMTRYADQAEAPLKPDGTPRTFVTAEAYIKAFDAASSDEERREIAWSLLPTGPLPDSVKVKRSYWYRNALGMRCTLLSEAEQNEYDRIALENWERESVRYMSESAFAKYVGKPS